jgi:hypothetical protein
MGAVILPGGDANLGGEDTENVTQVATEKYCAGRARCYSWESEGFF